MRATDPEGDDVTLSARVVKTAQGWLPEDFDSPLTLADRGDGTSTVGVDTSVVGEYVVEFMAADAHGEEWGLHVICISPASAGASG